MKIQIIYAAVILLTFFTLGCKEGNSKNMQEEMKNLESDQYEKATFGSGCFWCTEAIFERVKGVKAVVSGYSGGEADDPSYEEVCSGTTGHAEVIQVAYDPKEITYDELLEIFWKTHDPTTLNRQGNDVGPQYRSVIFYHNNEQKKKAEGYKEELQKAGVWKDPIVTEIVSFKKFFVAEKYHQDYYAQNPNQGYCSFIITPKIEKFEKVFKDKLKAEVN